MRKKRIKNDINTSDYDDEVFSSMEELKIKNKIADIFLTASGNDIFKQVVTLLLKYFKSTYGLFGYIDKNGYFICPSMTTKIWEKCALVEKDMDKEALVFHPQLWCGLWGRGLKEGQAFVSSGPFTLPEGHIQLQEVMIVPIMYQNMVIGQIVLADKAGGYTQQDEAVLSNINNYIAPILQAMQEREWAKVDLEKAKSRAESASMAKSQFLANMSHELRTPLHGMLGCLQLLENEQPTTECRELVQTAKQSGNALLHLINDLLEFSSFQYADNRLQSNVLNIAQELRSLERIFSCQLQAKGVSLQLEISGDIPQKVVGDRTRFRQILIRLVGNAIKFSARGSVHISAYSQHNPGQNKIHPYLRLPQNQVSILFVIADQGIGLSDDHLNEVFEVFTQGNMSLSRKYSGAGLGLSLVQKNVDLMHGNIAVDNSGPGTCIYLSLRFELCQEEAYTYMGEK